MLRDIDPERAACLPEKDSLFDAMSKGDLRLFENERLSRAFRAKDGADSETESMSGSAQVQGLRELYRMGVCASGRRLHSWDRRTSTCRGPPALLHLLVLPHRTHITTIPEELCSKFPPRRRQSLDPRLASACRPLQLNHPAMKNSLVGLARSIAQTVRPGPRSP